MELTIAYYMKIPLTNTSLQTVISIFEAVLFVIVVISPPKFTLIAQYYDIRKIWTFLKWPYLFLFFADIQIYEVNCLHKYIVY